MFTKRSYHHGIVLIRCEGCEGVHLIADNLGWFEDSSVNVEDIIKRNGEEYKKLSVDGLFQMSTNDIFKKEDENNNNNNIEGENNIKH
jgi:protein import protein ZIM17